jgi:hypothetical protein
MHPIRPPLQREHNQHVCPLLQAGLALRRGGAAEPQRENDQSTKADDALAPRSARCV